jgi:hypothetical protein
MPLSTEHVTPPTPDTILDRPTVEAVATGVDDPSVKAVAAAWLQAYDGARAAGLPDTVARCRGAEAWDRTRADLLPDTA